MASDQKVAVVTGAAGGLGACFARKLAELDYELILIDRREDDVNRLCGELRSISNMKVEPIAPTCATTRPLLNWPVDWPHCHISSC